MSRRLESLPAKQLTSKIAAMQSALQQLKAAQTAGSESIVLARTVTGNNPDFIVEVPYNEIKCWKATFNPADPTLPGTGFVWQTFFDESSSPLNTDIALEVIPTDPYSAYLYALGLTEGTTDIIGIAVVIYAVGSGTISIEEIS
jgi:hypothetical protein